MHPDRRPAVPGLRETSESFGRKYPPVTFGLARTPSHPKPDQRCNQHQYYRIDQSHDQASNLQKHYGSVLPAEIAVQEYTHQTTPAAHDWQLTTRPCRRITRSEHLPD